MIAYLSVLKAILDWNFSIISVIWTSKLHISDLFTPECVYLRPNVYIFTQMCIFNKFNKFSGL